MENQIRSCGVEALKSPKHHVNPDILDYYFSSFKTTNTPIDGNPSTKKKRIGIDYRSSFDLGFKTRSNPYLSFGSIVFEHLFVPLHAVPLLLEVHQVSIPDSPHPSTW